MKKKEGQEIKSGCDGCIFYHRHSKIKFYGCEGYPQILSHLIFAMQKICEASSSEPKEVLNNKTSKVIDLEYDTKCKLHQAQKTLLYVSELISEMMIQGTIFCPVINNPNCFYSGIRNDWMKGATIKF